MDKVINILISQKLKEKNLQRINICSIEGIQTHIVCRIILNLIGITKNKILNWLNFN